LNLPRPLRIVADTNCLVSAALAVIRGDERERSPSAAIFFAMRDGLVVNLTTTTLIYELAETIQVPRLALPVDFTFDFVDVVAAMSEFVPIRGLDMGCRDEDDDRLVETAVNGHAHALVSRDKDILEDDLIRRELEKRGCRVMSTDALAEWLRSSQPSPEEHS
jgi:putative PIN family toxin of toxin-antitoxin system